MRFTLSLLSAATLIMATSITSYGQMRPLPPQGQIEARLSNLELRLNQTEYQLNIALSKIDAIERLLNTVNPLPPPPPPYRTSISCLLVDSGYSKTFLASGRNRLEAEVEVRKVCSQSVHSSYCNGSIKCDDTQNSPPYARGFICMVTDSGHGRSFKGEGTTMIEAEAKAKMACQSSVHASYCGNVTARCEAI